MYDLLVQNGSIVDGTGSTAYLADVAVVDGEIVAIGKLAGDATQIVDAAGMVVSPGFIDLHTHSDLSFLLDPTAQSKIRQGVTFELAGNCGGSYGAPLEGDAIESLKNRLSASPHNLDVNWTDFGGYLDNIQNVGTTLNLAVQVGHGTIRSCVLGMESRPPDRDEMSKMKGLISESISSGAMGFSTGLFYAPGSYARLEEVIELASVAAEHGVIYSTHMRDEGTQNTGLMVAVSEAIEIGRRTGIKVEISHVKCKGPAVWGMARGILDLIERSRGEGIDVAGDQYPYTASSTGLTGGLFPRWSLVGGREATLARMGENATRDRMLADIDGFYLEYGGSDRVVIARYVPEPVYEGMSMHEIAKIEGCTPSEAALNLYEQDDGQVIVHAMSEEDLDLIATHPFISVASDGSSLSTEGVLSAGRPHPRNYGTFPRFLARMVREKKLVNLEEAIRRMTSLPAERLGLTKRGRLAPGYFADMVVFDPDTIKDTASFEVPHSYPIGIFHVSVNGVLVIQNGEFTGKTPGKIIRDSTH